MTDLIKELEARISAKRKELEDEESALATVRRMMEQPTIALVGGAAHKGEIDFANLIGNNEKKRTLIDEVRDVVKKFGENEFTVAHIEAALNKLGIEIDAKEPRARIGIAVSSIVKEGLIMRTFKGAGNVPHKYRLKSAIEIESKV